MTEAFTKIIPIILLLSLGYLIRYRQWADDDQISKIQFGIIYLALPAVLFMTFKDMALRKEYLSITLAYFLMLWLVYGVARLVSLVVKENSELLPFVSTGMAFGVLGIPLYAAVYGMEHIGVISIFGIGHETFLWFVYLTLLKKHFNNETFSLETIRHFIRSPVILSIFAGLLVNLLGFNSLFEQNILLRGVAATLDSLGSMTTPLIFIVVGYGIHLEKAYFWPAAKLVAMRYAVLIPVSYSVKFFVLDRLIGEVTPLYNMAFFTLLILTPPYVTAIFISRYSTKRNTYIINNALVIGTVMAVVVMIAVAFIAPV